MEKRVAVAFPVSKAKFAYAAAYARSFNENQPNDDMWIVFSDEGEADAFRVQHPELRYSVMLKDPASVSANHKVAPSIKKMYGVQQLFERHGYSYVAMTDCECLSIKPVDLTHELERYCSRKKLFGGPTDMRFIVDGPKKFYDETERARLAEILREDREYFWFNDVPVYSAEDWYSFSKAHDVDGMMRGFASGDFEFNVFAYHLLLHRGWTLEAVGGVRLDASFLESQRNMTKEQFGFGIERMRPMWCLDSSQVETAFLLFHLDR